MNMTMDELIELFPSQLSQALKIGENNRFPKPDCSFKNIVIAGMGGSGIGGNIVQDYLFKELKLPIISNKRYGLPAFVNEETFLIVCSYSGNTEETLSALKEGLQKGAYIVCITSGGAVEAIAHQEHLPLMKVPGGHPPRACLGYMLSQILFSLYHLDLIDESFISDFEAAAQLLHTHKEALKTIASNAVAAMNGKKPNFYAGEEISSIAIRWRQQLNENANVLAWSNTIPEMNHNELVGWHDAAPNSIVFFLHSDFAFERVKHRLQYTKQIVAKYTPHIIDIHALGTTYWEQVFSLIYIGDWISLFLSKQRGIDAKEIKNIDFLKGEMAKHD